MVPRPAEGDGKGGSLEGGSLKGGSLKGGSKAGSLKGGSSQGSMNPSMSAKGGEITEHHQLLAIR
jgi:hypothetical protein